MRNNDSFLITVDLHVSESDREYLELDQDLRQKLKRKMDTSNELTETKDALEKVNEEIRKLKEEMSEMRKEKGSNASQEPVESYALGYSAKEFLALSPTRSLQWISGTLVPRFRQEMAKHKYMFVGLQVVAGAKPQSIWTCSGFNRGGSCNAKWHVHERPAKNNPAYKYKDLRLHCCTLCYEGLGILIDHPFTSCPWIMASTWSKLEEEEASMSN